MTYIILFKAKTLGFEKRAKIPIYACNCLCKNQIVNRQVVKFIFTFSTVVVEKHGKVTCEIMCIVMGWQNFFFCLFVCFCFCIGGIFVPMGVQSECDRSCQVRAYLSYNSRWGRYKRNYLRKKEGREGGRAGKKSRKAPAGDRTQ